MPTSAPGSSSSGRVPARGRGAAPQRGFTLIELLVVVAIVALSAGVVTLALRDRDAARLDEEAQRLVALLEMARAESRVTGTAVRFVPAAEPPGAVPADAPQFRFVGVAAARRMPQRWLDAQTTAHVVGAGAVLLGPDAILPPQRLVLRLGDARLDLATDGLGPFTVVDRGEPPPR